LLFSLAHTCSEVLFTEREKGLVVEEVVYSEEQDQEKDCDLDN